MDAPARRRHDDAELAVQIDISHTEPGTALDARLRREQASAVLELLRRSGAPSRRRRR